VPTVNRYTDKAWLLTVDGAGRVIERYNRLAERIDELGLQGDVDAKPMLDVSPPPVICHSSQHHQPCALTDPQGREIVRILGARKNGQWTGKVLAEVIKWQLGHTGGTKEQCSEWLRGELAAGRISTEDVAPSAHTKRQKGGPKETAAKKIRI
jgi:tRNA nucleotidyltransferase (CCA-adding enzyme)